LINDYGSQSEKLTGLIGDSVTNFDSIKASLVKGQDHCTYT